MSTENKVTAKKTEIKPDELPRKQPGKVTVKVLIGTLRTEEGTFEKGDVFTTTPENAQRLGNDVQVVSS